MTRRPHVLVIGGGIGGLCLAQGLKGAGVSVAVYERTRVRADWLQGYRIHISPHGSSALHECLPTELWDAFTATAGKPSAGFGFLTEQLKELLFLDRELLAGDETSPAASHHSVSRITLRQVLLGGMDDVVHHGKEFARYVQAPGGRVTAYFSDGTSVTGDVLVAADGANSRVRRQYLPHARRIDTGVVAIVGKLPLDDQARAWLPRQLSTSVNNIMPPKDSFMFAAVWAGDRKRAAIPAGIGGSDDAARLRPGMLFDNTQDYLFWAYAAKRDAYPAAVLDSHDGRALQHLTQSMISGWHPALLRMIAESDPATIAPVYIRSMAPVDPWQTTSVTLLGDAIHNMTPMAGIGANTALRDARLLCQKLTAADRGRVPLLPAIHEYEAEMLGYGFAAVKLSLRNARQATSGGRAARAAFKAALRVANAVPPVKRQMARSMRG
jgi:2-polyprenyl-6-methoxyphenol hydroxylase-like FAD-dependent oxidoreductase